VLGYDNQATIMTWQAAWLRNRPRVKLVTMQTCP